MQCINLSVFVYNHKKHFLNILSHLSHSTDGIATDTEKNNGMPQKLPKYS
jgi:hypothetical protein